MPLPISFQDCHGGSISFPSRKQEDAIKSHHFATCTDPIDYEDTCTQTAVTTESHTQTANQHMQEEEKESENWSEKWQKATVSADIQQFLSEQGRVMLHELSKNQTTSAFFEFANVKAERANEDDAITELHTLSFDFLTYFANAVEENVGVDPPPKLQCTGLSWNSTGSVIAIAYGRYNHSGWCNYRSALCLWNIFHASFDSTKPDIILESESGLMCVAHHPTNPAVVAAGTFNGEILVWNTAADEFLVASSSIGDYFHREPISKISWTFDMKTKEYQIVSISGDGKVLMWNLSNKLEYPREGYVLSLSNKSSTECTPSTFGGTAISFRPNDRTTKTFVFGTEGGKVARSYAKASFQRKNRKWSIDAKNILSNVPEKERSNFRRHVQQFAVSKKHREVQINTIYSSKPELNLIYHNAIDFQFKPHAGPVQALTCSPFHRSLFLSCSADGTARLWHFFQKPPMLVFDVSSSSLFDIAWSKTRPLVFAVASEDGYIYIYDLKESLVNPCVKLEIDNSREKSASYCVEFNPIQRNFLASGDSNGLVHIWKLNWRLANIYPSEQQKLEDIAELGCSEDQG